MVLPGVLGECSKHHMKCSEHDQHATAEIQPEILFNHFAAVSADCAVDGLSLCGMSAVWAMNWVGRLLRIHRWFIYRSLPGGKRGVGFVEGPAGTVSNFHPGRLNAKLQV
jgi:hypothetical protein